MKLRPRTILIATAVSATVNMSALAATPDVYPPPHSDRDTWYADGQKAVQDAKGNWRNIRKARNVILFIGDGMGISTVTAARILTFYYFAHFLIILPLLGRYEKTKPLPNSISESVLGAGKKA